MQPPAHAGSSLADFSSLRMEPIRSSETSVHSRSTRRHNPQDGNLLFISVFPLRTVAEEISNYKLDLVEYRRSDGANIHFSMERGMRTMNYVKVFSYIRESYQQLRGWSSLVIGCSSQGG
jgi:hypothetical protein